MKDILRDIVLNAEAIARESRDLLTDKNYIAYLAEEKDSFLDLRDRIERISSKLNILYCKIDEKSETK